MMMAIALMQSWSSEVDTTPTDESILPRAPRYSCLLCGEEKLSGEFLQRYRGYDIRDLRICCRGCEMAFNALPLSQLLPIIQTALHRRYLPGQVIYTLHESDTNQVRYIGRTCKPAKRFYQHRHDVRRWSFEEAMALYQETHLVAFVREGSQRRKFYTVRYRWREYPPTYTEGAWLADLDARGALPVMTVVEKVADAPLVVERELRWICQCLQAGYPLVNACAYNAELLALIRCHPRDFLHDDISTAEISQLAKQVRCGSEQVAFIRRYTSQRYY